MEISEITYPVFFITRISGLTPMSLKRDLKGRICGFRRSIGWLFYSVGLFLTTTYLMYRACINDSESKYPIRLVLAAICGSGEFLHYTKYTNRNDNMV